MRTLLHVFAVALFCAAQFISLNVSASGKPKATAEDLLANKGWSFVENIGQLNGAATGATLYYGHYEGATILFKRNEVIFHFSSPEANAPLSEAIGLPAPDGDTKYTRSIIKLSFQGSANPAFSIYGADEQPQLYNYYTAYCPNGLHGAKAYKVITYKNIYPYTDLVFKAHAEGLKYEFVVHPGGNVKDIKMSWSGTQPNITNDGGMTYSGLTHIIKESAPVSYTASDKKVASSFKKDGNMISFKVGDYNNSETLIIDPLLRWGTYYGGNAIMTNGDEDRATDIGVDAQGNIYLTGTTNSLTDIATAGAYQDTLSREINGLPDMFIAKFDSKGQLLWGTYFGDTTIDLSTGIDIDSNGDIYISGVTLSPYRLGTQGTHQPSNSVPDSSHKQSYGGVIAKFNSSGQRVWSTYFGGDDHDGFSDIAADDFGNIYAVGFTQSDSIGAAAGLDTSYGGEHSTSALDAGDAVIVKFKATDGLLVWSTYFGGSRNDHATAIDIDATGRLLIGGNTFSTSDIASAGSYQSSIGNSISGDMFIAKLDTSGHALWSTYYGGTSLDACKGIKSDKNGNIYLSGYTSSSGMTTTGAVDDVQDGYEGLISKFSSAGSRLWATYYGGFGADYLYDMDIDSLNKVYLLLQTTSEGLASEGAYRDSVGTDGFIMGTDAVILILDEAGNRVYSTYYGGSQNENARGIAVDPLGAIYITGGSTSNDFVSTYNTHKYFKYGHEDVFLVRFDSLGMCKDLFTEIKGDTVACADALTIYSTPYDVINTYQWYVEGGQIAFGEYNDSMGVYWYAGQTGKLKVVARNDNDCRDSSMIEVNILPAPQSVFSASNMCLGDTLVLVNDDTTAVQWLWDFGDGNTSQDSIAEHVYTKTGFYTLYGTIWNKHGCSTMAQRLIQVTTVSAPWTATLQSGRTYVFAAKDTFHTAYYWDFGDGNKDTGHTVMHTFAANGNYTVTLEVKSGFGCSAMKDSGLSVHITGIAATQELPIPSRFYPNPVSGKGWLEYELSSPAEISVSMYDLAGREVLTRNEGMLLPGKYTLGIDASAYEPGMYYIVLRSPEKQATQRIMIK